LLARSQERIDALSLTLPWQALDISDAGAVWSDDYTNMLPYLKWRSGSRGATSASWARRFFDNWKASLKWQRLKPYEKFAAMVERHWDGIAASSRPENKVSLGFVEGLNNKIRVIQRARIRLARRGVSAAEDPHLHAAAPLK
jgi:hypothetical protein